MMMCDKQKNNFIKLEQRENCKTKTENLTNTIISQNTNNNTSNNSTSNTTTATNRSSKFNKTKSFKNKKIIYSMKDQEPQQQYFAQQQPNMTIAKTNCVQQHQQHHPHQQQTIIGKVFKQEVSMAQQALKQTQMTLKQYFEYSNHIASTTVVAAAAATTQTATTAKRLNKQKYVQQQQINQNCSNNSNSKNALSTFYTLYELAVVKEPTIANTSEPTAIVPKVFTAKSFKPLTTIAATTATGVEMATATTLISPAIGNVENLQSNIQQCDNVCIHSKCSSKQKCLQQTLEQQQQHQQEQQHQHHCKSANICSYKNNYNDIRTSSNNITLPTDITNSAATTTTTTARTNSTTSITTTNNTNKANISSNTTTNTTATATLHSASHTAATTTSSSTTPTYCKAFPLRRFFHNTQQLECLLRTVMFSFIFVMSMQYQTVSASTSMLSKHEPMFISRSETFKFVAGDTIVLPCEVANTDPYVVAWKRGIAILTAGSVKVTPDPRVRLVNGFNLQIRDAVPQDAGDYICQIATMEPREITHTVEILVPPRIHHISTSGHLQVKKGSSVRIECSASGNPTPNVTWSRKNNILPNGEEKLHSHILSIENVDRHKGGVYICTANNGVGQPASSQVVLHVLYPPEITVERPVVFSGEGHEAMLVCIVHGETQPEVIWFKDTMQLDTTERHIMENRGSRHTLIIRKVHTQDFGNYSCVAENQLGKSRKTLQLSGKPNVAVFNSPPISQYKDRYNISWTVESHTPIEEYKLSFRRLQQGQEVDNSIDSHSSSASSSSSMLQMYGSGGMGMGGGVSGSSLSGVNLHNYRGGISSSSLNSMGNMAGGGYGSYGAGNVIHWGRNDWRDVVLPAIPTSHHYTQGMSYMIRGLDPDQHYEATVQARNRFGWSDYSQSFVFSTSSNDNEMRDLSVTFYGSKSSRLDIKSFFLVLILAVTLCVSY